MKFPSNASRTYLPKSSTDKKKVQKVGIPKERAQPNPKQA
jgi:hypothetical protein